MHIQKTKPYTLLINLSSAESELQVAIHSSSNSRRQTNAAKTKDQQTKTTTREIDREVEEEGGQKKTPTQEGQHDTLKANNREREKKDTDRN